MPLYRCSAALPQPSGVAPAGHPASFCTVISVDPSLYRAARTVGQTLSAAVPAPLPTPSARSSDHRAACRIRTAPLQLRSQPASPSFAATAGGRRAWRRRARAGATCPAAAPSRTTASRRRCRLPGGATPPAGPRWATTMPGGLQWASPAVQMVLGPQRPPAMLQRHRRHGLQPCCDSRRRSQPARQRPAARIGATTTTWRRGWGELRHSRHSSGISARGLPAHQSG